MKRHPIKTYRKSSRISCIIKCMIVLILLVTVAIKLTDAHSTYIYERIPVPVPTVLSLGRADFRERLKRLMKVAEAKPRKEQKRRCKALMRHGLNKEDMVVTLTVMEGDTIHLPCVYCGVYTMQKITWTKTKFAWEHPWDIQAWFYKILEKLGVHGRESPRQRRKRKIDIIKSIKSAWKKATSFVKSKLGIKGEEVNKYTTKKWKTEIVNLPRR